MTLDAEIVVIGAGLSGLALAAKLRADARDVIVLEARDRSGGRILSEHGYDLGPAWIWPHNHRMLALAARLGLETFPQQSAGRLVFEDAQGAIRRDLEFATMGGALRVKGGLARMTDALAKGLEAELRLVHAVHRVVEDSDGVTVTGHGFELRARRAVVALPLRLAAGLGLAVPDVPTWMAGHAKLIATYPEPFWRTEGLNGDAISHRGPLAEIHDASPEDAHEGALFGFAVPGAPRKPEFRSAASAQLERLFGPEAAEPNRVLIKDWSADSGTATRADLAPLTGHPTYRAVPPTARVVFAGTETAPLEGGFLEGALEAAEAAHLQLNHVAA